MGINKLILFEAICNGCGNPYNDEAEDYFETKGELIESLMKSSHWGIKKEDETYCEECIEESAENSGGKNNG